METTYSVSVIREQAVWLTEEEAFTLLMALVRGAAAGSEAEDTLLDKMGMVCRLFIRGAQEVPVESAPEDLWFFEMAEDEMCLQAA
jgi:hypothetical protein